MAVSAGSVAVGLDVTAGVTPAGAPDQHTLPFSHLGAWKEKIALPHGGRRVSWLGGGTSSGAC